MAASFFCDQQSALSDQCKFINHLSRPSLSGIGVDKRDPRGVMHNWSEMVVCSRDHLSRPMQCHDWCWRGVQVRHLRFRTTALCNAVGWPKWSQPKKLAAHLFLLLLLSFRHRCRIRNLRQCSAIESAQRPPQTNRCCKCVHAGRCIFIYICLLALLQSCATHLVRLQGGQRLCTTIIQPPQSTLDPKTFTDACHSCQSSM